MILDISIININERIVLFGASTSKLYFYFHHICLLWEICDIKMFLFLFIADFCMPINADHNSNRLKSHLLPPVSNDCKFSLFSLHFCDISQMQSHMNNIPLQFLRHHVYHMLIFFYTKCIFLFLFNFFVAPQNVCVHIVNSKVESCHQTTSFRTFKLTKPGCI